MNDETKKTERHVARRSNPAKRGVAWQVFQLGEAQLFEAQTYWPGAGPLTLDGPFESQDRAIACAEARASRMRAIRQDGRPLLIAHVRADAECWLGEVLRPAEAVRGADLRMTGSREGELVTCGVARASEDEAFEEAIRLAETWTPPRPAASTDVTHEEVIVAAHEAAEAVAASKATDEPAPALDAKRELLQRQLDRATVTAPAEDRSQVDEVWSILHERKVAREELARARLQLESAKGRVKTLEADLDQIGYRLDAAYADDRRQRTLPLAPAPVETTARARELPPSPPKGPIPWAFNGVDHQILVIPDADGFRVCVKGLERDTEACDIDWERAVEEAKAKASLVLADADPGEAAPPKAPKRQAGKRGGKRSKAQPNLVAEVTEG